LKRDILFKNETAYSTALVRTLQKDTFPFWVFENSTQAWRQSIWEIDQNSSGLSSK